MTEVIQVNVTFFQPGLIQKSTRIRQNDHFKNHNKKINPEVIVIVQKNSKVNKVHVPNIRSLTERQPKKHFF